MSFFVIEGPNGSGKTTLIKNFSEKGYTTLSSPNGTPLAKILRPACRGTEPWTDIDKKVQFMLFSAARLDEYIRCVQNKDEIVIADRWWTSTYVYQCILQGLSIDFLEHTIHDEEKVDLVILLDGDHRLLKDRVKRERDKNTNHGKCRWTQDDQTMIEIMSIYRNQLTEYLKSKGTPYAVIQTDDMDEAMVLETAEILIKDREEEIKCQS